MHNIFIAGAGGIGQASGLILAQHYGDAAHIYIGDISESALSQAKNFVTSGTTNKCTISTVLMSLEGENEAVSTAMNTCDIILDCLPGSQAPKLASWALKYDMHYANLTEYVAETEQIMEMAKDASRGFVLQTGLAPGFINVLACKVFEDFATNHKVDKADCMTMKVGALSQHAQAPHFYAFTWSPIGVATEYVKDADAVRDYQKMKVPALSGAETIIIDGETYEDNFTSGGAADLPEFFAGRIKDLDYKTLRYPGHYDWAKKFIDAQTDKSNLIQILEKEMLNAIPSVEDDVVIVYSSVKGKDANGVLRQVEKSYKVMPSKVGNHMLRAIQSTTAGPLCQMAIELLESKYAGIVLQSQIDTDSFLNGDIVKAIYGGY